MSLLVNFTWDDGKAIHRNPKKLLRCEVLLPQVQFGIGHRAPALATLAAGYLEIFFWHFLAVFCCYFWNVWILFEVKNATNSPLNCEEWPLELTFSEDFWSASLSPDGDRHSKVVKTQLKSWWKPRCMQTFFLKDKICEQGDDVRNKHEAAFKDICATQKPWRWPMKWMKCVYFAVLSLVRASYFPSIFVLAAPKRKRLCRCMPFFSIFCLYLLISDCTPLGKDKLTAFSAGMKWHKTMKRLATIAQVLKVSWDLVTRCRYSAWPVMSSYFLFLSA